MNQPTRIKEALAKAKQAADRRKEQHFTAPDRRLKNIEVHELTPAEVLELWKRWPLGQGGIVARRAN